MLTDRGGTRPAPGSAVLLEFVDRRIYQRSWLRGSHVTKRSAKSHCVRVATGPTTGSRRARHVATVPACTVWQGNKGAVMLVWVRRCISEPAVELALRAGVWGRGWGWGLRQSLLDEVHRLLRPGGMLLLTHCEPSPASASAADCLRAAGFAQASNTTCRDASTRPLFGAEVRVGSSRTSRTLRMLMNTSAGVQVVEPRVGWSAGWRQPTGRFRWFSNVRCYRHTCASVFTHEVLP